MGTHLLPPQKESVQVVLRHFGTDDFRIVTEDLVRAVALHWSGRDEEADRALRSSSTQAISGVPLERPTSSAERESTALASASRPGG